MEGTAACVVGMEDIRIDRPDAEDEMWKKLNGKIVSVIYLFSAKMA